MWHCHIVEHEDNEMMRPLYIGTADEASPVGAEVIRRGMFESSGACEGDDASVSMHHR